MDNMIFKHVWIIFLIVILVNVYIRKKYIRKYIESNPELKSGYDSYFKWSTIITIIPWLIIGFGNLSGLTQSVFDYFNVKSKILSIQMFHGYTVFMTSIGFWWIFIDKGSSFFEKHPGLFEFKLFGKRKNLFGTKLKIVYALMMLGEVTVYYILWNGLIPIPNQQ